ncbi:hypothetical protein [Pedobacter sp. AJM]|uniref:hypothetical protein n=1 Tax=Pedobacter sp. AJM TaxID=2003629 RepID=UPI000B4B5B7E|nr:hypothetical protein [Pedobacter sp. AJM]OWK71765.1 hypothetical protein CBW18_04655 [Pedobacter sp. AJM]
MQRNVLTIATGKEVYWKMAINLIRSFLWWNNNYDINFQIVTDLENPLPTDISGKIEIIKINQKEYGTGFSTKLHLDKFIKNGSTLFIDSDCLIFEPLDSIFKRFKGLSVSVVGNYINGGEWFGNISEILTRFSISSMPKFNGGIYYIEKNEISNKVFETARVLEKEYDNIGFTRLRSQPNDEVIISLAMQLNGQTPLIDDGTIMSDPQACRGPYHINVLKGTRVLINPKFPDRLNQDWYPFNEVQPVIVHFLGEFTKDFHYKKEVYRLHAKSKNRPELWINLVCNLSIKYPATIKNNFKAMFRPLYHKLWGFRSIKQSERIL